MHIILLFREFQVYAYPPANVDFERPTRIKFEDVTCDPQNLVGTLSLFMMLYLPSNLWMLALEKKVNF